MATKSFAKAPQRAAIAAALLALASGAAHADLVLSTNQSLQGTGLGAVDTVVTVQDNGAGPSSNGTESGCVRSTGGATFATTPCLNGLQGGDNQTVAGNQTRQVSTVAGTTGTSTAGNLALIVNVAEPGSDNIVVLTDLYLALFNTTGTLVGNFQYTGPDLTLAQLANGIGGSGYLFVLDAAQAAMANAACPVLTGCFAGAGVQFANGSTAGASETVFIRSVARGAVNPPQVIPEPTPLALLSAALIAGAALSRRRPGR